MYFNVFASGFRVIEPESFIVDRREGSPRYLLFHFNGSVEMVLKGEKIFTSPGAVILFEAKTTQFFKSSYGRLNHDYVDFEVFDTDFFKRIGMPLNEVIYPRISKRISQHMSKMVALSRNDDEISMIEKEMLLESLLIDIASQLSKKGNEKDSEYKSDVRERFEEIRINLYNNPSKVNVKKLAKESNFSVSYFNKMYKKFFDVSPIEDINKSRIEFSKSLLKKKEKINNIVNELGFSSNEYFYRWFKNSTGQTPKEYVDSLKLL